MKIKKAIKNKKIILSTGALLLLLIVAPLTYVYALNGDLFGWKKSAPQALEEDKKPIDYNPPTQDQKDAGNSTKTNQTSDTPPAPTQVPGSDKKNVEVSITSASQGSTSGNLQIRAQISAIDTDGICTLTLTSAGKPTIIKTAGTQALATISTCSGFDIPSSELSSGLWNIQIQYSSPSLSGSTSQDTVVSGAR